MVFWDSLHCETPDENHPDEDAENTILKKKKKKRDIQFADSRITVLNFCSF